MMPIVQKEFSEALKKAALNEKAKHYLLHNQELFKLLLKAARRYIGGETLEDALDTRRRIQEEGLLTSLEFMGENVHSMKDAEEATAEFLKIIENLKKENIATRVSLDLSHLGLFLDHDEGLRNFNILAEASNESLVDLVISAEGLNRTEAILETYFAFSKNYPNVGITLQAYLHRTEKDLKNVIENSQGKVRMVKGAYSGNQEKFLSPGIELNNRYVAMVATLFKAKRYCSIATHDNEVISEIIPIINKHQIPLSSYEFEMLYGIGTDRLHELKGEGHPCRQYIVYGKEWYLYFCNRVAENPENIFKVFIDIIN